MGIRLDRVKKRNYLLSACYFLNRLMSFVSGQRKLRLYLDLAWVFHRLAHEQSYYTPAEVTYLKADLLVDQLRDGQKVLDIGCGRGYVIARIQQKDCHVTGVDFDADSLREARHRSDPTKTELIESTVGDFMNRNVTSFDVVVLSHILEHLDNPELILNNLQSRTKSLYVEVPDFESNSLNPVRLAVATDLVYSDGDHVIEFSREELQDMLENAGFFVEQTDHRFGVLKFWCRVKKK